MPAEYFAQPHAPQPAQDEPTKVAAVGATVQAPEPPVPPPELFEPEPIPQSYGDWVEWHDVGRELKTVLGEQQARQDALPAARR